MSTRGTLEFANFTCKFGLHLDMLEFAGPIVIPAFLDTNTYRTYRQSRIFILDSSFINYGSNDQPLLGLTGRIVKDTILESEQIYDPEEGLVKRRLSIPNAPSALFVLLLNNHKLIYLSETKYAPSLSLFGVTMKYLFNHKRELYLEGLYEERDRQGRRKCTKTELRERIPRPIISILPLSSSQSFHEFLDRFGLLAKISVSIRDVNQERDAKPFLGYLRDDKEFVGATSSSYEHRNTSGLNVEAIEDHLNKVARQGIARVSLSGRDTYGASLRGNNDNFKVRIPFEVREDSTKLVSKEMVDHYNILIEDETLLVEAAARSDYLRKIRGLASLAEIL